MARGQRVGRANEFRLTERWTSSTKSVFQFDGQGTVAKSTHSGIPWLRWLREEAGDLIHMWPFDGWQPPPGKAVIVEVYPSIFRNRCTHGNRTGDEQDAFATACWMAKMAERGALARYFAPPLNDIERATAEREGWIMGIASRPRASTQPQDRRRNSRLHCRHSRGHGAQLRADDRRLCQSYRAVVPAQRFQYAMKAAVLVGVVALLPLEKGARIPSTAEDVCAETRSAALRAAANFKCGLDCLSVMKRMVHHR